MAGNMIGIGVLSLGLACGYQRGTGAAEQPVAGASNMA
jgi:hypothetical protein